MTETVPAAVVTIWIATLAIVVVVIVPLAIKLLSDALSAARSIQFYTEGMLQAGIGIAGHTGTIAALDGTLATAGKMVTVAGDLESHTGAIGVLLSDRAAKGKRP
jgi:hypothetical protein